MKGVVDEALDGGASDSSRNDVWRQPGDACIDAFAVESSRIEGDEFQSGCIKTRNQVRGNMTKGIEAY